MDEQVKEQTATDTVTMSIPADQLDVTTSSIEEQKPEVLQEVSGETINNSQEVQQPKEEVRPQRNEKGQFLEGNQESKGLENSGRPCEFCQRPVEIMNKVNLYREWCRGKLDGHLHIPYIQELISEDYLDVTIDQFEDWVHPANHKEQHAELTRTVAKLLNRQQLNLLKVTLTAQNRGAIFQLSANHGMMEQSKQLQGGIKGGEPMEYNIHIVPKKKREEIDE